MPRPTRPIQDSEIPSTLKPYFNINNQGYHPVTSSGKRAGKRQYSIERICMECGQSRFISVSEVRAKLNKSTLRSTCRECTYERRIETAEGYVWIYRPDHPKSYQGKYVPEHILIMEESLGRFLNREEESVHHINGVRDDNRIENLQLRNRYHGKGIVKRCVDCGSHNIESVAL